MQKMTDDEIKNKVYEKTAQNTLKGSWYIQNSKLWEFRGYYITKP